ncbi:MAG TPA: hypothetical protein VGI60_02720 [Chthoniobacterales bacterium]|jgi:Tfp pilus assembly protein PilF
MKTPLEPPERRHLQAAIGYLELGMAAEANAELEEINSSRRQHPDILAARVGIYRVLRKWELMRTTAEKLVVWNPREPSHFVDLAYATRRARSLLEAHAVLTYAAELHPKDPVIQFNLACYESQLGSMSDAKKHLAHATKLDKRFGLIALEDPDLRPLWASLTHD